MVSIGNPWIAALLLVAISTTAIFAEDAPQTADQLQAKFDKAPLKFMFVGGPSGKEEFQLVPQPLLNWSNPERRTPAGAVYIWTLHGRPEVAMSLYPNYSKVDHEFQSLSRYPFNAKIEGREVWNPKGPGIEMKTLETDTKPAESKVARLRQMRALAREFTASLDPRGKTKELRMLPSPIYRYSSDEKPVVVDGTIFAFVQGTDPEVLLLIEAVKGDDGASSWHYGLGRMSMVAMEVRHNDRAVWKANWAQQSHTTPYKVVPGE
ncbi:hypothetical protein GC197_00145 [bacterium]|nr:hypothetical protein [bacterium]